MVELQSDQFAGGAEIMVHPVGINGKYYRLTVISVVATVNTSYLMYPIDSWKVEDIRDLNLSESDNFMSPAKNVEAVEGTVYDDQLLDFFDKGFLNRCSDYVGDEETALK